MLKKLWVSILSILSVLCLCFGFACSDSSAKFEVKFKEGIQKEIYLSDEVDLEDWIVRVDGADVKLTVTYTDVVSGSPISEVFEDLNTVFRAKQEGEHTLVYEASIGKTTKSAEMKFSVIPDAPKFKFSTRGAQTLTLEANGTVERSFNKLIADSSMSVSPSSATTAVTEVWLREFKVGLGQAAGEWKKLDFTQGAKTYTFSTAGEYKFVVEATSGKNTTTDEFLVNVLTPSSDGTQTSSGVPVVATGKNVLFSEEDPYTMKMTSGTVSRLAYAVLADKYASGEKVSVMFRGSAAPQIGFNVIPSEEAADKYSATAAQGGFLSFEYKSNVPWVFYYPNMLGGSTAAKTPGPAYSSYTYLNETLDENKNYLLQAWFVEDKDGEPDASGDYEHYIVFEIFEVVSYEANDEESRCYVGDKITGHTEFYGGFKSTTKLDHDGTVVIYGSQKSNIDVMLVDSENVAEAPLQELAVEGVANTYAHKAQASVANGKVTSVTLTKGLISSDDNGTRDNLRYIGQTEGFGLGKTLSVSFSGKNMPAIGIFLGNAGNYKIGTATGGTGLYIHNSNMNHDVNLGKRLIVNGPYRLQRANIKETPPYDGRLDSLTCISSDPTNDPIPMGYQVLDESKNYRFEVSCLSVTNEFTLTLKYTLYEVAANGTETEAYTATRSMGITSLSAIDFASGAFAFYGSTLQDITFSYELKEYTGNDVKTDDFDSIPQNSFSAKYNSKTGTYQLASGSVGRTDALGYNNATFGYAGLGKYAVGDTIVIEYTGKNIPNVSLFASENGVQPIATGATGLFLQSSVNAGATNAWSTRYALLGSYLWDPGKTVADKLGKTYTQELGKNWQLTYDISNTGSTSYFGLYSMNDNTQYRYTITTAAVAGDATKVTVISKLESYDTTAASWTELKTLSWTVAHGLDSLENRYAIVHGLHTSTNVSAITFKVSLTKAGS